MSKVLIAGAFNVLHPGHLRLLRFAREAGEYLSVAVLSDRLAGASAHVREGLRIEALRCLDWIDEVFIADEPVTELIERLQPDIVVKGKEHELRFNPELAVLESYGGALIFSSGETIFSSIELIRKEFAVSNLKNIELPIDYLLRHDIQLEQLKVLINKFQTLRVCVLGDLIVDEYITCEPLGMSQEDPTIVVAPIDSIRFIGGAGIVAAHAAGLGASVQLLSVSGNDLVRDFALRELHGAGVSAKLLIDETRPTTLKQRFRSKGKTLLRVSHLHQGAISIKLQKNFIEAFERVLEEGVDLVVFSDFNYGCLPQSMVIELLKQASGRRLKLAADSQSSSQVGDISRFHDMDLLTPTEREARVSTRNREDGLVVLAEELRNSANAQNILLKLGEEGLLIHAKNSHDAGWLTDRIDALNSAPKDVAGAGDSLLITSALALACDASIWEAACLGALAAAIQVSRVGNTPLSTEELLRELS
jgi:rfaE bifunctional protein kinase chain/domain